MKTKTKMVTLMSAMLMIGMVIGFLGHGVFFREQSKRRALRMRSPDGFVQRFEEVIQPTDAQREKVNEILTQQYTRMMTHQDVFRQDMDIFRKRLDSVLTGEQKTRLHESMMKDRSRPFGKHPRRGAQSEPGGGPPPQEPQQF
ncbi:MAG TPA: hypothetical protein ENN17_00875 [bacterium]|nr:hypothetical protein [bacterium]